MIFMMKKRRGINAAFAAALAAGALCSFAAAAAAQTLPLDDKARYEKALEQKVDDVLLQLLGPNQAKVVVQATMDFTRTEKVDVASGVRQKEDKSGLFKWQTATAEAGQPLNEYLLPGFPVMEPGEGGEGADGNKSYQKQTSFPASFIKKLVVTVIVNKTLPDAEAQNVRTVVSEVLSLDAQRGDELSVIRTPFAPVWRTIWYTPEAVSLVFKYGILSLIGIIGMIVVAVGFLKLAGAMNTMAKAQQSHQITMDMAKQGLGGPGLPGLPGAAGGEAAAAGEKKDGEKAGEGGEDAEKALFNIKPEHVDFLVKLMSGEDPANVALVAAHLSEDVKSEFLRRLPADFSAEVVANIAQMRFVEPEVIATIREELEKRLAGAFGGVNKAVAAMGKVSLRAKKEMLASLELRHPDLAREVRPRIFLADDLLKLTDKDMSLLATSVKLEDWALALWELPGEMRPKLKAQLADKSWAMLEQTMKYGSPSAEKKEAAVEGIVTAALKLMDEGRMANPLRAEGDALPAEAAPRPAYTVPLPPPPPAPQGGNA
ncbi:MAG: hypothetical protein A2179_04950 [Elusimicrobia bacterium GWC2_63_65]|nr:MAG: hypothetical protein A2179_04950 [Elusimicrobia bacterium GWC2_63_65]